MADKTTEPPILTDGVSEFSLGINSGIAPLLVPKNQLSFAINSTVRGHFITHRPCFRKGTLTFPSQAVQIAVEQGNWQGGCYYKPDSGPEYLVAQIGGRLFTFTPDTGSGITVAEVTIPGDPNPASAPIAWLWQSEKWVIVNDGQSIPIFYDGTVSRRSNSNQTVLGTVDGAGFTVPAIGAITTITLIAPFLGQIGESFFIDGFTYQATAAAGIPNATVTTLFDAAANHAIGESVIINPNVYGVQNQVYNLGAGAGTYAPNTLQISVHLDQLPSFPNGTKVIVLGKVFKQIATGGFFALLQNQQTITILPTDVIQPGTVYVLSGTSFPITTLGTLKAPFVPPAVGVAIDIEMSTPYTGTDGQAVFVGSGHYTIKQKPQPPPGLTISAININDTGTGAGKHVNKDLLSIPELPPGRMGVYGMGRNWECLTDGRSFIGSDIVGATSGTQVNAFRDSVLKTTENTYLAGGGVFLVPGNIGNIQAMIFATTLDASLGQGPLQVFTPSVVFSVNAPVDRALWAVIQNPILTQSLISNGALNQNGTVAANGDTIFRSIDGIRSLLLARREFSTWGNTPISHEVERIIEQDSPSLLEYGSAEIFQNRMLMTSKPTANGQGTSHRGLIALNFEPLSSIGNKEPSVYDGLWTGINTLQIIQGTFSGLERCFSFSLNQVQNKIEIYELLPDGDRISDFNGVDSPITWEFETGCLFKDIKNKGEFTQVKLLDGQMYVSEVSGNVDFQVFYRPQFSPCWQPWINFGICATQGDSPNIQKQNRVSLGLGKPPTDSCDQSNNRPYYIGETFQIKVVITGHCRFYGLLVKASVEARTYWNNPICGPRQECRLVSCPPDDDYGVYQLQDLSPLPPTESFFNQQVSASVKCPDGDTLVFTGTLPSWITVNAGAFTVTGTAGIFRGTTQEAANITAQQQLNSFVAIETANGNLHCQSPAPTCGSISNCQTIGIDPGFGAGFVAFHTPTKNLWACDTNTFNLYVCDSVGLSVVHTIDLTTHSGAWDVLYDSVNNQMAVICNNGDFLFIDPLTYVITTLAGVLHSNGIQFRPIAYDPSRGNIIAMDIDRGFGNDIVKLISGASKTVIVSTTLAGGNGSPIYNATADVFYSSLDSNPVVRQINPTTLAVSNSAIDLTALGANCWIISGMYVPALGQLWAFIRFAGANGGIAIINPTGPTILGRVNDGVNPMTISFEDIQYNPCNTPPEMMVTNFFDGVYEINTTTLTAVLSTFYSGNVVGIVYVPIQGALWECRNAVLNNACPPL